jgi:hypothetical protein
MTYADAYREAYDCDDMSDSTIRRESSRLMTNTTITTMVNRLIAAKEGQIQASAVSDREKVLSKLRGWMECAEGADAMKIRSAELLGKSVGLFKDVVEQKSTSSSAEVEAKLQAKLEQLLASEQDQPSETSDLH